MSLLDIRAVLERTGIARSTFYRLRDRDEFPQPVDIGCGRAVLFRADEIDDWIAARGIACRGRVCRD